MTVSPLGDSAVVVTLAEKISAGTARWVAKIAREIERHRPPGTTDVVPAFASVAVFFDPAVAAPFEVWQRELENIVARIPAPDDEAPARTVEVPVCYAAEYGPDLEEVAHQTQMPLEEVVQRHASGEYQVHAIGFAPGFPYLGGLPAELATPRRATPRPLVPAGTVGIGGAQTGIYPIDTPGGWNLIGRTPLALFDPTREEPALLRTGDRVMFRAIDSDAYRAARASLEEERRESAQSTATTGIPGIEVVRAGMFTTVQDLGRRGHRALGVPLGGAADPFALRMANLLVGNREDAAAIEFTLVGPELRFIHDTVIALGGGEFGDLPRWRPIAVAKDTTLRIGSVRNGCRGYLALAGGIEVPPVLGSRSTYVRARLGGFEGRRLTDGDVLPVPEVRRTFRNHWRIDERILPAYAAAAVVRVIAGEHESEFDPNWSKNAFKVSAQSDRMGVRLAGQSVARRVQRELVSAPVAPGTVQVPPDGRPIVLLADAQTIGGYPMIAHVISVDLPLVAQLRPGDSVRFVTVSLATARELFAAQERAVGLLREGLAQKLA